MEVLVKDIEGFNQLYIDKYGDEETPCFLLGNSLGGLITSYIASQNEQYAGMCLVTPHFEMENSWKQ